MYPQFGGVELPESRDEDAVGVQLLELDRGEHAEGAVAALAVMEDLKVLKDGVGQLDAGPPSGGG